jgi:CheY-like chemotaxis protein
LNNAAKYQNEHGAIDLRVRREGEEVVIAVRDHGIGLSPEMLSDAFELFTQGERTPDRAQGGLGIGLSLVKKLVELHGGSVRAASDGPGLGSEFVVRLPRLDRANVPATATDTPPGDVRRMHRILVVDDNIDAAESLAMLLRLDGHDVTIAHDGVRALEAAHAERPNVVLLDIGLPGMDGYEVCLRLRAEGLTTTRVIALTGYGQDKDKQLAMDAGFDEHTVKPVEFARLMKLLAAES